MRQIIGFLALILIFHSAGGQQVNINQTNAQLAQQYMIDKEFEKAAPLFRELYDITKNNYYFQQYLTCMIQQNLLDEAEDEIKREIKKIKVPSPDLYIHWGYILKLKKQPEESSAKYEEALRIIPKNTSSYIITSNTFLQWSEFEMARRVYLSGRQNLPAEKFSYELATIYQYLRNYESMMEEFLDLISQDEKNLARVQSRLASTLSMDIDNDLLEMFKKSVLKRIQANPNATGFNRLLIWFLVQEKKFSAALRQYIALDRRTGGEDASIAGLAQMALNNGDFDEAREAYEYIIGKGKENPFYRNACILEIHSSYMQFVSDGGSSKSQADELEQKFDYGFEFLGYSLFTYNLVKEYAHLLAFYSGKTGKALEVLGKGLNIPSLRPEQAGELKTELADVYLYSDDPWEATLLYSQVIEANKNNQLGDEAKLKKAKLAYYTGNFDWAKAQLDVLKASTSKLTANDALELSLLISSNLNLDTTAVPLQLFARADLLFFRNKDSLALATIDTLENLFPYHSLVDDILYRKATINIRTGHYNKAAEYLEEIKTGFSWESLADDAVYQLARLYHNQLNDVEKAKENYKEILFRYPGSFYVSEARKYYRELTGDTPDPEKTRSSGKEEL